MNGEKLVMGKEVFEKYESKVRSYCRKWPVEFSYAKGSIIKEDNGKEYIDFFNGAGALNYGHNPDYIKEKLIDYIKSDAIIHSLDMYASAKSDFMDYFETNVLKPRDLDYKIMFPGPTGTNGIEAALKLARKVTKRSNVFALMGAFHGMTLGSLALTTDVGARNGAGVKLNDVTHIPTPYFMGGNFDSLKYIEEILTDDHSGIEKPAAIVVETTQAEGGIYVMPKEFLQGIRVICDKYDILMIVDDIQVGCGRTGYFFSFERANVKPDIVVLSKSIGGYGFPLSLTLFKPELDIWTPGEHNGTFRGFQPSMVTAKAGLELMIKDKVPEQAMAKGIVVEKYIEKEIKPLLKDEETYRGIGLIWGIDFKDGKKARSVLDRCFEKGLIIELAGRKDSVLKIMPSLVIEEDLLKKGLSIIKESIKEVNETYE